MKSIPSVDLINAASRCFGVVYDTTGTQEVRDVALRIMRDGLLAQERAYKGEKEPE
jgi:hypothetical protein